MSCLALSLNHRRLGRSLPGKDLLRMLGDSNLHKPLPYWESGQCPGLLVAKRLLFVEADPYSTGDRGRESDKPGVGEVVRGTGFAAEGMLQSGAGRSRRTVKHHALEQIGHGARRLYANYILHFRIIFLERVAFIVHNPANVARN